MSRKLESSLRDWRGLPRAEKYRVPCGSTKRRCSNDFLLDGCGTADGRAWACAADDFSTAASHARGYCRRVEGGRSRAPSSGLTADTLAGFDRAATQFRKRSMILVIASRPASTSKLTAPRATCGCARCVGRAGEATSHAGAGGHGRDSPGNRLTVLGARLVPSCTAIWCGLPPPSASQSDTPAQAPSLRNT